MKNSIVHSIIILCIMATAVLGQGPKRNRGQGMYLLESSNTAGAGNLWLGGRATGFIWANKALDTTNGSGEERPGYFPFAEVYSEIGLVNIASLVLESRVFSYTRDGWFQFGNVAGGIKITAPNNKELRFFGYGLLLKYKWNSVSDTFPSLAGYRVGTTGFAPEGYIVDGSQMEFKLIGDLDFLAMYSWLPLKLGINMGMRIPFKKAEYVFPQYLLNAGVSYNGLGYDFFVEYSLEAFDNFLKPKQIPNMGHPLTEVSFSENLMYVSLGGRLRYNNGVTLFACVPFLVSANQGSAMTLADLKKWHHEPDAFADEKARGITDAFDPWFARWKIVVEISFPLFYRQTGAEMMRNFLLLKGSGKIRKIDIDEQLNGRTQADSLAQKEEDKKARLDEIKKRREQIQNGQ